jgi:hypothetical protein
MQRHLDEILVSQAKMLARRGEPNTTPDDEMRRMYAHHLEQVERFIESHPTMSMVNIDYGAMVQEPLQQAQKINAFLGRHLDVTKMAAVVDAGLYRNRAS